MAKVTITAGDVVTRREILQSLRRQVPAGKIADFQPTVDLLCGNADAVTLDALFLNVFSNSPLPFTVGEQPDEAQP